jgi:outer membrane protein assembly factor BamE (lipoprotein component of BamABCDE complex)
MNNHCFSFSSSFLKIIYAITLGAGSLLLSACQGNDPSKTGIFQAHKVDIPQGNYVTKEMLALVKEGMSPSQVKFALGAPLLTPVFSSDRWDYVFRLQYANGTADLKRVIVIFKDGKVAKINADDLPSQDSSSKDVPKVGS